jgi:hypothetical protein
MRNVTVAIDEATLRAARRVAAERSTSLNALIRGFLQEITCRASHARKARRRIAALSRKSNAQVSPRTWTRADLHER